MDCISAAASLILTRSSPTGIPLVPLTASRDSPIHIPPTCPTYIRASTFCVPHEQCAWSSSVNPNTEPIHYGIHCSGGSSLVHWAEWWALIQANNSRRPTNNRYQQKKKLIIMISIWGRRKTEAQSGWMSWAHAVDACSGFSRLGCRVPAHHHKPPPSPPPTRWPGGLKHTSHTALKWQRKPNRTSNIIISLWQSSAACIVGDPFNSYSPLRCNAYSFFFFAIEDTASITSHTSTSIFSKK